MNDFEEYIRQGEPEKKEKSYAWQTAIGLQQVDGLKPSAYLIEIAKQNIEGDITIDEVKHLIDHYYKTKTVRTDDDDRTEEADKVSARITEILSEKTFSFSPTEYINIHRRLFNGLYKFAGKIRNYNITKSEWALNGETVLYAGADNLKATLEYDFEQEKNFNYKGLSKLQIVKHIAHFIAYLWQIHIFGEGNTRTTAVFLIKYLRKLGFEHVNNDIFAQHSWYFRNALVRANYNNLKNNIHATNEHVERFLRNLLLDENNILKNRELHINYAAPENVSNNLSNKTDDVNGGVNDKYSGVNSGVNLLQKQIIDFMRQNPRISVAEIAKQTNKPRRSIENNVKKLKEKGIISRVGSDKTGSWKVEIIKT